VLDSVKVGIEQRERRKAAGVTLENVSDLIGLSVGYLSNLENGRRGKLWNHELIKRYNDAVEAAKKKQKTK
jgi:transcriptional regulator with XRE-family HTH domain